MPRVISFFKRNIHIFVAVLFVIFYLCLSVVFMLSGFDGVVSTIFSNIILSVVGFVYIHRCFKPKRHVVTPRYAGAMLFLLLIMWLFSQVTATWVLNHIADKGFDAYQSVVDVNPAMYVILALVFAPVAEEILFRGIVFNAVKSRFPVWVAYIVSSLGFAIMHGTIIHIIIGFVCGMVFAMVYEYTGNIGWSILFHCIYNFMSMFLAGITVPDLFFNPIVFISVDVLVLFAIWCECRRISGSHLLKRVEKHSDMPAFDNSLCTPTKSELICSSEHDDGIANGFGRKESFEPTPCRYVNLADVSSDTCEAYGLGNCYSKDGRCPYDGRCSCDKSE